jgi:hypothetical protein
LLTLLGAMALWFVIEPPYGRLVAAGGIQVLHLIESPHVTDAVHMVGAYALVSHTEAYKDVADQRLELRTHHHNVPLLVALILAGPGIGRSRRVRSLLIGLSLLSLTHVLDFMVAIHWHYAFHNVGPYRVTDLNYLKRGLWAGYSARTGLGVFRFHPHLHPLPVHSENPTRAARVCWANEPINEVGPLVIPAIFKRESTPHPS